MRPQPVDLTQFEGMTPGPWSIQFLPADNWKIRADINTANFPATLPIEIAHVGRLEVNARAIAALPALIADLRATREERDRAQAERARIRERVQAWRDEAYEKAEELSKGTEPLSNPVLIVLSDRRAEQNILDRVLALLDGED